jgi:type IV pilus assembly protein PilX
MKTLLTSPLRHGRIVAPQRQRGVILIITLIILVAMTLAAVSMIRSVDTSSMIAGNLAFQQSATNSGDAGVEAAIAWLEANGTTLEANSPANGYYATSGDTADLTGNKTAAIASDDMDWTSAARVKKLDADAVGNEVAYVIHRMCNNVGPLNGATCATGISEKKGASEGGGRQMGSYQPGGWQELANRGFYRITARITGPKNNTSYVQAIVTR